MVENLTVASSTGEVVYDSGESLIDLLGLALHSRGLTIAVAESCTGGLLGGALTSRAGSSTYFLGGVIAYDDRVKARLLGVETQEIVHFGAVSPEVAMQMARGARNITGADIGVAITGISGPAGGTPAKPLGTTYIALASNRGENVVWYRWNGSREENRAQSVSAALQLVVRHVTEQFPEQPNS